MQAQARPRVAIPYPVIAVAAAAGFFLVVALSVALQPPDTSQSTRAVDGPLAWARAVFFSAGALAFILGILSFARAEGARMVPARDDDVRGMLVTEQQELPQPWPPEAPIASPPVFTLIALGRDGFEPRAIEDFGDVASLLAAMTSWRTRHPDEQIRVFDAQGAEIARRAAVAVPAFRRVTTARPGLFRPQQPSFAPGGA